MLQLKNTTPFPAHIAVLPDEKGVDTLYATLKASFTLGPALEVADEQRPVLLADEYWGEPGQSSLKYAADVHLSKPSTDIALVGQAHATGRKPVAQLDASLSVAGRRKVVRVFGERAWRPLCWLFCLRKSAPRPFRAVPLIYEHAFGGMHQADGKRARVTFEPRNPVGMGYAGRRRRRELRGLPLPHLEDPSALIKSPRHRPAPAGFGFVAPSWEPRKSFAGTYDEAWQKRRAPYLPDDFDPRFFNAAHPDLVTERHLEGGERVEALNVSPSGPLRFRLPVCRFKTTVRIAGRDESPPLQLETVLIEPDDARLTMLWRGAVPCDKQALKVEEVALELQQLDLTGSR
jgi:hypothetical protein